MSSTVVLGIICLIAPSLANVHPTRCPSGGLILERGLSPAMAQKVLDLHNKYRTMLSNGSVPNQPIATNIKTMVYDDTLAGTTEEVSNSCVMEHIWATDPEHRWSWVGQNIYIRASNKRKPGIQEWDRAVEMWFEEEKDFIYPNSKKPGSDVSHYTQLVWANTTHVGCDYIFFEDPEDENYPYVKLYTCNYGPGGNYVNRAPYATDDPRWNKEIKKNILTNGMEFKNKAELKVKSFTDNTNHISVHENTVNAIHHTENNVNNSTNNTMHNENNVNNSTNNTMHNENNVNNSTNNTMHNENNDAIANEKETMYNEIHTPINGNTAENENYLMHHTVNNINNKTMNDGNSTMNNTMYNGNYTVDNKNLTLDNSNNSIYNNNHTVDNGNYTVDNGNNTTIDKNQTIHGINSTVDNGNHTIHNYNHSVHNWNNTMDHVNNTVHYNGNHSSNANVTDTENETDSPSGASAMTNSFYIFILIIVFTHTI